MIYLETKSINSILSKILNDIELGKRHAIYCGLKEENIQQIDDIVNFTKIVHHNTKYVHHNTKYVLIKSVNISYNSKEGLRVSFSYNFDCKRWLKIWNKESNKIKFI